MKGTRLADTQLGGLPDGCDTPGAYWKYVNSEDEPLRPNEPGNLTNTMWGFCGPHGGIGTLSKHTVREEEDGTISVRANDGSSNSIRFGGGNIPEWHGYIEHGVWNELGVGPQ